jgi:acylphosphatase
LQRFLKVFYMITQKLRIRGDVQGVGYRYALRQEAQRRGVTGWVRNRTDRSVEALLQGSPERVAELVAWARRGPPDAHVDEVQVDPAGEEPAYSGFELRPTL